MTTLNAAYTTLLTKDSYIPAALVLNQCLIAVRSKYPLVIMVTPQLSNNARQLLARRGLKIQEIESLQPKEGVVKIAEHDQRFNDTWTKLRAFDLIDYDRVVLLDSDMVVLQNMDDLFDMELPDGWIAAVHACVCNPRKLPHYPTDWIPENCAYTPLVHPMALTHPTAITPTGPRAYSLLNGGNVLLRPSRPVFEAMVAYLETSPLVSSFSFPDQDFLAAFFRWKWKPLPWCYNALKTLKVIHSPLWRDEEIKCLHYILHDKPWHQRIVEGEYGEFNEWWWARLDKLKEELILDGDAEGWKLIDVNVAH